MLVRILALLAGQGAVVSTDRRDDLQVAVAALLVESARMDDRFEESERALIERLLSSRFALSASQASELLDAAERSVDGSAQLFGFTRTVAERMSPEERMRIVEMLWEIAYADGVLAPQEDALIRRIAGLIYVSDSDRMAARRRVRQRLGMAG